MRGVRLPRALTHDQGWWDPPGRWSPRSACRTLWGWLRGALGRPPVTRTEPERANAAAHRPKESETSSRSTPGKAAAGELAVRRPCRPTVVRAREVTTASVCIEAPIERVWKVFSDVEGWPEWTMSVRSASAGTDGVLRLGADVKIVQPLLSTRTYEVTAFEPGRSWTWVAASPGLRTTATHRLDVIDATTTLVQQTIRHQGPLARPVALTFGQLTNRYLTMEADGLRERSESGGVPA